MFIFMLLLYKCSLHTCLLPFVYIFYDVEGVRNCQKCSHTTIVILEYGVKNSIPDVLVLAISYLCV